MARLFLHDSSSNCPPQKLSYTVQQKRSSMEACRTMVARAGEAVTNTMALEASHSPHHEVPSGVRQRLLCSEGPILSRRQTHPCLLSTISNVINSSVLASD